VVLGAFRKLKQSLGKTREQLVGRLGAVLKREVYLDDATLEQIEEILIGADVGVQASTELAQGLKRGLRGAAHASMDDVTQVLAREVERILVTPGVALPPWGGPPHVVLMAGVNGVGKTTTIAKLARWHQQQGRRVLLAAADTFRAAAVEQLTLWAQRAGVEIVKQGAGADPAAVAFDALAAARARSHDVVIIDTAGRLQTKDDLMAELGKIARVLGKQLAGAPHETLLCLDATTGQNGIVQAKEFAAVVPITGICLTKLDGSAKGGIVVAIAKELGLPVRYVGTGEGLDDFELFDAAAFAAAMFAADAS
jgi:fused signal recognition particle receptor